MSEHRVDRIQRRLSEDDAPVTSFHDCHIQGLLWSRERFEFAVDMQYILRWIEPDKDSANYRFLVAKARLLFHNADSVRLSMNWDKVALDAEIDTVRIEQYRHAPSGTRERRFEIDLANPEGHIGLWSTSYEVLLFDNGVISDVPNPLDTHG